MQTVIVRFTAGAREPAPVARGERRAVIPPTRFRIVLRPSVRPRVEVADTDALGAERWQNAQGFSDAAIAEHLREALLKAYAVLPPFGSNRTLDGVFVSAPLYPPGVTHTDLGIEIDLGAIAHPTLTRDSAAREAAQ